jgi:hypothetical protein
MAPCADSPTDFVPPPSYQISQEQFDRKTSHAIQLSSSIQQPIIDENGWPIYDEAAFEAVAKSYEHSPPGSSSAGLSDADFPRHGRQASYAGLPASTDSMKVRSSYLPFSHSIAQKFTPFHRLDQENGADGITSRTAIIPQSVSQPPLHLSVQLVPLWMAHRLKKL